MSTPIFETFYLHLHFFYFPGAIGIATNRQLIFPDSVIGPRSYLRHMSKSGNKPAVNKCGEKNPYKTIKHEAGKRGA